MCSCVGYVTDMCVLTRGQHQLQASHSIRLPHQSNPLLRGDVQKQIPLYENSSAYARTSSTP